MRQLRPIVVTSNIEEVDRHALARAVAPFLLELLLRQREKQKAALKKHGATGGREDGGRDPEDAPG